MTDSTNLDDIVRVLQHGDLVRIIGRNEEKLKGYDGYVGRIVGVVPVDKTDEEEATDTTAIPSPSDEYKYDIDLELGDVLHGIGRSDLHYTAEESRSRRKRKPNSAIQASNAIDGRPEKKKQKNKKATTQKQTKATTAKKPKKAAQATTKQQKSTTAANKRRPSVGGGNQKSKGTSSKKAKATPVEEPPEPPPSNTNGSSDMYEKHRREFERSLARLEKADAYHFFLAGVPKEFEECYTTNLPDQPPSSGDVESSSIQQSNQMSSTKDENMTTSKEEDGEQASTASAQHEAIKATRQSPVTSESTVRVPDTPPYNFHIIRKRMEHGRYILDRNVLENQQHLELITPYFQSIGREIPKNITNNGLKLEILHPKGVDWDIFQKDVVDMCDAAVKRNPDMDGRSRGSLGHAARKIKDLMSQIYEKTGRRQGMEMSAANDSERFYRAMNKLTNAEAAMQTKWRREAFPERCYKRLETDAICAGLSELDERIASYELKTTLEDKFIGLSYTYDDTGQSEGWMKSLVQEAGGDQSEHEKAALAMANDDGVIKAQVAATMNTLLIAVQDKVMTELGVLEQKELKSANWIAETNDVAKEYLSADNNQNNCDASSGPCPDIVEQPVWGIDCYTRRNITTCLETLFDSGSILVFIEKWLLPAINACPADLAHNIANAARMLEGLPFDESTSLKNDGGTTTDKWKSTLLGRALINKIAASGPVWLKSAANMLRRARESLGPDFFRVHPKGHGSIVLCPKLEPNRLVTYYRGEVYPSWRWGEKMDAISMIQEKKGLKPGLPDFFNMALERPQIDPRGYGLLFVDASRKSGYGSMLSHSCQPSCEVRVASVNGRLTLAMTTLREMAIGDELTFDYNAVTESLNEYQAAICLCGHTKCRGSFLHFATADCYQQVLNRNSPIAVRLSNLIKGGTKRVMSEEDYNILIRHGFNTAAFGAVSVNRHKATSNVEDSSDLRLDSMDMVPVWLRTFVADTLRYIEYERRALPIALICNELFTDSSKGKDEEKQSQQESTPAKNDEEDDDEDEDNDNEDNEDDIDKKDKKPIKGARPMPTFFFFARGRREHFVSILMEQEEHRNKTGLDLKREIQKLAAADWKLLDAATKEEWKQRAVEAWEAEGGREKEELEKQRLARIATIKKTKTKSSSSSKQKIKKEPNKSTKKKKADDKGDKKKTNEKVDDETEEEKDSAKSGKISFHAADGEGISAMEQRIQQLTQTLSRVGRVLDRHREKVREKNFNGQFSEATLRDMIHPPLDIMPDEHVVAWVWNHEEGVVRTLMKYSEIEVCVCPEIRQSLAKTEAKYSALKQFGEPWRDDTSIAAVAYPFSPAEGRGKLTEALLKFREDILNGLLSAANEIKDRKASTRKAALRKKKEKEALLAKREERLELSRTVRSEVQEVIEDLISEVEKRNSEMDVAGKEPFIKSSDGEIAMHVNDDDGNGKVRSGEDESQSSEDEIEDNLEPWMQNFNKRFKLQKAADILLLYAKTSTFFSVRPYSPLVSTPIEVYARELGNSVPKTVIDTESVITNTAESCGTSRQERGEVEDDCCSENTPIDVGKQGKRQKSKICEPEDIVANVAVEYQGDYVVSQLLQWYNAGIDQKPGLPDLLGCVMLPPLKGCFAIDFTKGCDSLTSKATGYQTRTRRRIVEWLQSAQQRGSPWPDDIRRAFVEKDDDVPVPDASSKWVPLGSPILDFLVTGEDRNIYSILQTLGIANQSTDKSDGLLSSVDHGRPAQAVSNWVQCENPACQKWRKVPWHVDIDMISEKFQCKDNVWNPQSASCDAPEDVWDDLADAQVDADGSAYCVEPTDANEMKKPESAPANSFNLVDFKLGAKFDVLRTDKDVWSVGVVVKLDVTGEEKRVKFHFVKTSISSDEWIDIKSPRIAVLHTKTTAPAKKEPKEKKACAGATKSNAEESVPGGNSEVGANVSSKENAPVISSHAPQNAKRSNNDRPKLKKLKKSKKSPSDDDSKVSSEDSVDFSQQVGSESKVDVVVPMEISNAVTDESSRDDSLKTQTAETSKPSSNAWTIPKKKRSPTKAGQGVLEKGSIDAQQAGPRSNGGGGSNTVTDESSPDDSLKIQTKIKPSSNVWTIPKKKRSPVKAVPENLEKSNSPSLKSSFPATSSGNYDNVALDDRRLKSESEFQIARKAKDDRRSPSRRESEFQFDRNEPRMSNVGIPGISDVHHEASDDDGSTEQGEICSPTRRQQRERKEAGRRYDYSDRNECSEGLSHVRTYHGRHDDRGDHSRIGDGWEDCDRSPRGNHAPSHGSAFADDRRDRRSYSSNQYNYDRNDEMRYVGRDESRPFSRGGLEGRRSSISNRDYGDANCSDYANFNEREKLRREYDDGNHYDRRREQHGGDYEIPRESYRRTDDHCAERSSSYESRNIFQDRDSRRSHDRSRYDDYRRRGEELHLNRGARDSEDYHYSREELQSRRNRNDELRRNRDNDDYKLQSRRNRNDELRRNRDNDDYQLRRDREIEDKRSPRGREDEDYRSRDRERDYDGYSRLDDRYEPAAGASQDSYHDRRYHHDRNHDRNRYY